MAPPQELTLDHVIAARECIRPYVRHTPVERSRALSAWFQSEIHLKLETWQITGSFKLRGALNKMLALPKQARHRGVLTASAGNHGLGVAHAAHLLGLNARIVVPETASPAKRKALEYYPATLEIHGADYDEAEAFARELHEREGLTFVHAFDDPAVIAGQGTVALELLEDLPALRTVVVPVGGGGLISGVAVAVKALKPNVKIVGVQSEASPAMYRALREGRVVETPIEQSLADGLTGRFVSERTLRLTRTFADDVVLVSEAAIRRAVRMLLQDEHILVEGSAAVGLAALLERRLAPEGATALLLTGRNVDSALLRQP